MPSNKVFLTQLAEVMELLTDEEYKIENSNKYNKTENINDNLILIMPTKLKIGKLEKIYDYPLIGRSALTDTGENIFSYPHILIDGKNVGGKIKSKYYVTSDSLDRGEVRFDKPSEYTYGLLDYQTFLRLYEKVK